MDVQNRAAENGSIIISDATERTFPKSRPLVALRVLVDTTITAIESSNTEGIDWYVGRMVTTDDPVILANVTLIQIAAGGAIQGVYT